MPEEFSIELTTSAYGHIESLRRFDRNRVLDGINEQLRLQPTLETRNKKLLRENLLADWELRIHPFRVFYDVDEAARSVRILAVGVKDGDKLLVGGEEVEL